VEDYSDLIVYVTVKEIKPSAWNTNDGEIPPAVQDQLDAGKPLWSNNHEIYTDMIVTVDHWAKGSSLEEITVRIEGGQVDNIVQYMEFWSHNPWDFEPDAQYLLYLKDNIYAEDVYHLPLGDTVRIVVD